MSEQQTTLDLNGPVLSFTTQPVGVSSAGVGVGSTGGGTATFVGIATVTFTTVDGTPTNPATNTGSIAYQWYEEGVGALSDSTYVTGTATTTLTLSNLITPTDNQRKFYLEADYVATAYQSSSPVTAGTARSTGNAINEPLNSNTAFVTVFPLITITSQPGVATVTEGFPVNFSVDAILSDESFDNNKLSYQWQSSLSSLETLKNTETYTTIDGFDQNLLSLDIYHFGTGVTENRPVIIYIHGGAWAVGDKANINAKATFFNNLGYIFISVNYRLSPAANMVRPYSLFVGNDNTTATASTRVKHSDHVSDCATAVAWVYNNVGNYGGDENKLVLIGHSAGCHLASLLVTNQSYLTNAGLPSGKVIGCIANDSEAISGIFQQITNPVSDGDADASTLKRWYQNAFGIYPDSTVTGTASNITTDFATTAAAQASYTTASPISHISGSTPPFLVLLRGENSRIARESEFVTALQSAGRTVTAISYPGSTSYTHSEINESIGALNDPPFGKSLPAGVDNVTTQIQNWLASIMSPINENALVQGASGKTLTITPSTTGIFTVNAIVSHPNTQSVTSNNAVLNVLSIPTRKLVNFEYILLSSTNSQLLQTNLFDGEYIISQQSNQGLISFYSPEIDINVEMDLYGGKGFNSGTYLGGQGGFSRIRFTMIKNTEYVIVGLNSTINTPFIYRKGTLIATVGAGGNAGTSGKGGSGGGIGVGGEFGFGQSGGLGGGIITTGNLPSNGIVGSATSLTSISPDTQATAPNGGRVLPCTRGVYWRQEGVSPCSDVGTTQFRLSAGAIVTNTASITRGFKAGYGINETSGQGSAGGGNGGSGATGGQGGTNGSGGGGGSGYTDGSVTVVSTQLGGSTEDAKVILRLVV
jgi:acetyl esterase/lipase